jgi:low density lipoprotein-related protein 2
MPSNVTSLNTGGKQADPCVPPEKKCDGYLDCRSGKDEDGCPGIACRLDQFRCANGNRCIDAALKCNHKNDCGDNSDEAACSKCLSLSSY